MSHAKSFNLVWKFNLLKLLYFYLHHVKRAQKKTTSEEVVEDVQLFFEWKRIFHNTFNHATVLFDQTGIAVIQTIFLTHGLYFRRHFTVATRRHVWVQVMFDLMT